MGRIAAIIGKELRLFLADPQQVFFAILMPLALIAMMVGAFGGGQSLAITGYVVDLDQSTQSIALVARLSEHPQVTVRLLGAQEAADRLQRADISSYLVVPPGFGEGVGSGQLTLQVQRRGNGGTEGQILVSFAVAAANEMAAQARIYHNVSTNLTALGLTYDQAEVLATVDEYQAQALAEPVVTVSTETFGTRPEGVTFFVPGLVAMFALFAVALTSEDIVVERKSGTLERLMTTRLNKGELLLGKFLAFVSRTYLQILVLFLVAGAAFKLFTPASFLWTMLFSVAVAAAGSAFALLVASLARSQEQAVWGSVIITNVSAMLGGSFMEVNPGSIVGRIGKFTLNYHANVGYRALLREGLSFGAPPVRNSFLVLLAVTVALIGIAVAAFRVRSDA